jgi:hypothetical protein
LVDDTPSACGGVHSFPAIFLNMTNIISFVKRGTFSSSQKSLMLYSAERCARLHKRNYSLSVF